MARRRPAPPSPRDEILALQRALYSRQRREIDASLHAIPRAFRAYEGRYLRHVARYRRVLACREAVLRAAAADVVFVGDYHTLPRAQRAYLALVEELTRDGRAVALGLEFVLAVHQPALEAWMARRISERTLLRRIGYPEHHLFEVWPNFRPVLEAARARGLPVLGLDLADGSLARRDRHAAERIEGFLTAHPGIRMVVLAGQLHVAPPHLPAAVGRAFRAAGRRVPRWLVVYQNCEEIYWQLAAAGLEHEADAVEISEREVCLINSSPVVAQQSYLDHLHAADAPDGALESAPERTFATLCEALAGFLELDPGDALDRVNVHALGDLSFLRDLQRSGRFTPAELGGMKRRVLAGESFYLPRAHLVYLGSLSLNHAAEEAAHFLRHALVGDDGEREDERDAFYARVMNEALAFFGSKIVNPRRQCLHEPDLQHLVGDWDAGRRQGLHLREVQAARLALAHLRLERGLIDGVPAGADPAPDADVYHAVTHLLGYALGDRLHRAMHAGRIRKGALRRAFLEPLAAPGAPREVYLRLSARLPRVRRAR